MPRQKTADDYYDDEYAKEMGKIDARRHAARRRAQSGGDGDGCSSAVGKLVLIGCGSIAAIAVIGFAGFCAFGMFIASKATISTEASTGTASTKQSQKGDTTPTTADNPEPPVTASTKPRPTSPVTGGKPPPPVTTLITPPANGFAVLGESKLSVNSATTDAGLRAKWAKEGSVVVLTSPTEVELIGRDDGFARIKYDGKEWLVLGEHVPAK